MVVSAFAGMVVAKIFCEGWVEQTLHSCVVVEGNVEK